MTGAAQRYWFPRLITAKSRVSTFNQWESFWKYCVVKCHLPFLRFNLTAVLTCFHSAGWQCSMQSSWCRHAASGSLCFKVHFAGLRFRECSEILMGCVWLFRAEEGCGPVTQQMDNADSPWALACNIFLMNWKVFASSSGLIWWPPFLLTFSHKHRGKLPSPSQPLLLQPGSEQHLLAFPHKPEPLIINSHASGQRGVTVENLQNGGKVPSLCFCFF